MKQKLNNNESISYLHLHLYWKLCEAAHGQRYLPTHKVLEVCRNLFRVPKQIWTPVFKKMEEEGLIKRIHKCKYELVAQSPKNILIDASKESFEQLIEDINIKCKNKIKIKDESVFELLPSKQAEKLKQLNCWLFTE